jgi:lysophospholipase L1-like esterase
MKRNLFRIITLLILWAFAEIASIGALSLLAKYKHVHYSPVVTTKLLDKHVKAIEKLLAATPTYFGFSRKLGWTVMKNGRSEFYQANSQGLRGEVEYTQDIPEGVVRISAFGDSFTHSNGVKNPEAWTEKLRQMIPGSQVLNFGVSGYGLDQAYLRFQNEGRKFKTNVILIGFLSDDIYRHVNTFRPFFSPYTSLPMTKPRFVLEGEKMSVIENPNQDLQSYRHLLDDPASELPRLGENDFYWNRPSRYKSGPLEFLPSVRVVKIFAAKFAKMKDDQRIEIDGYFNPKSEAYKITVALFDNFVREAKELGAQPVIMLFPQKLDLIRHRANGTKKYQPLIDHFEKLGYPYVDAADAFSKWSPSISPEELVPHHYSADGYALVARQVYEFLHEKDWDSLKSPSPEENPKQP